MNTPLLSDRTYNILKHIALVVLPGLATLYAALANAWGWGYSTEIVATITAIDTFMGVLLGLSSARYTPPVDGILNVDRDGEVVAALSKEPSEMSGNVTLGVHHI